MVEEKNTTENSGTENKQTENASGVVTENKAQGKKEWQGRGRRSKFGQRVEEVKEFDQVTVDLARVTRVVSGGKRMSFRACVAMGDKKGKVGVGLAKGADVTAAINKAANQAKKNMVSVKIVNDTIAHEVFLKNGASQVLIKPAPSGHGIIAGGVVRIVLELSGIKNATAKLLGTNNKINNSKTVVLALQKASIK